MQQDLTNLEHRWELAKNKARIQTLVAGEPTQKLGIQAIFGTRSKTRFQELVDLYEKDKLHIHIRERFPLCKANAAAHRKVESGHGRGKGCSSNQLVLK